MGSPAEGPEPQDSFQYKPNAEEEGEGWGSDGHVEICASNLAGSKKKKKRKKRSAVYINVGRLLFKLLWYNLIGTMSMSGRTIIKMRNHCISLSLLYTVALLTIF